VVHGTPELVPFAKDGCIRTHDYAVENKDGMVRFLPQPTKLCSITAKDDLHFRLAKALFLEGVAFPKVTNDDGLADEIVNQIVMAWKMSKITRFGNLVSNRKYQKWQAHLTATLAKHSQSVESHMRRWLREAVPGMHLTDLFRLVCSKTALRCKANVECSTTMRTSTFGWTPSPSRAICTQIL
jgi:hypothetical protein